jgi:hypothetical protein
MKSFRLAAKAKPLGDRGPHRPNLPRAYFTPLLGSQTPWSLRT